MRYGRRDYDFREGVLGFTAPLQTMEFNRDLVDGAEGWLLFLHKDLLVGSTLDQKFDEYGFFHYDVSEGLHMSTEEEMLIQGIFRNIEREYLQALDQHSKQVVLSNVELLLTYAHRFYKRQFILRNDVKPGILAAFEKELKAYYRTHTTNEGLPSVEYFANRLHLSPNYLSDLLKSLTGKSTLEHIHFQIIEEAKVRLLASNNSIAEVAYSLGFDYPQYFSRLFKNKTGISPKAYRYEVF